MSVARRTFIIVGGATVVGAGTYAWLRKLGYDVDPSTPRAGAPRPKSGPLPHDPFDPIALLVLGAIADQLLPGDPKRGLPPASQAGVPGYLIAAAAEPGMRPVRDEILKLTRHLNLAANQAYGTTFDALAEEQRASLLAGAAEGQGARPTFNPARALEALLRLSLEGYLGHPAHGGNRGASVWDALRIPMPRDQNPHHGG